MSVPARCPCCGGTGHETKSLPFGGATVALIACPWMPDDRWAMVSTDPLAQQPTSVVVARVEPDNEPGDGFYRLLKRLYPV